MTAVYEVFRRSGMGWFMSWTIDAPSYDELSIGIDPLGAQEPEERLAEAALVSEDRRGLIRSGRVAVLTQQGRQRPGVAVLEFLAAQCRARS